MHTHTQEHKHTERVEGCIQSNFTLLFSVPAFLFPVDSFTPSSLLRFTLARGEEKSCGKTQGHLQRDKQMTCSTTSFISTCLFRWSGPLYLISLRALKQTPSTSSIIHSVCMCESGLVCYWAGPASVATIIIDQLRLAVLSPVNTSEKYSNAAGGV